MPQGGEGEAGARDVACLPLMPGPRVGDRKLIRCRLPATRARSSEKHVPYRRPTDRCLTEQRASLSVTSFDVVSLALQSVAPRTAGVPRQTQERLTMTALDDLQREVDVEWPHIVAARAAAQGVRSRLGGELEQRGLVPADTAVVAFGSLAREEWTSGSDLDWTLLVDGQVSTDHLDAVQNIRRLIADLEHKKPGPSAVFGGAAFSHDIVHRIGGDLDTNRITTQRVLLLLESTNVRASSEVRKRVTRALLQRYVGEDLFYRASPRRLPRFLLNDVVRYWRTSRKSGKNGTTVGRYVTSS